MCIDRLIVNLPCLAIPYELDLGKCVKENIISISNLYFYCSILRGKENDPCEDSDWDINC